METTSPFPFPLQRFNENDLVTTLDAIRRLDPSHPSAAPLEDDQRAYAYAVRNQLVYLALARAISLGMPAGFDADPKEPDYMVAYIELPEGQVSWHVPRHPVVYDGHSTPEKYARAGRFVMRVAGSDICRCGARRDNHAGADGSGASRYAGSLCTRYALARRLR